MSDADFDALRGELKEDKSTIAVSKEPKCYIEVSCFLVHEFYVCLVSTCYYHDQVLISKLALSLHKMISLKMKQIKIRRVFVLPHSHTITSETIFYTYQPSPSYLSYG